jgi:hypothetical protein
LTPAARIDSRRPGACTSPASRRRQTPVRHCHAGRLVGAVAIAALPGCAAGRVGNFPIRWIFPRRHRRAAGLRCRAETSRRRDVLTFRSPSPRCRTAIATRKGCRQIRRTSSSSLETTVCPISASWLLLDKLNLERGLHALHSGMDVKAYAESVGRKRDTVQDEVMAARVKVAAGNVTHDLSARFSQLVAIHAAREWLWPALVEAMLSVDPNLGERKA